MREHPGAGRYAAVGLVERRVGVADGDDDVARSEAANRVESTGQLWREREQSKRAHREHLLESIAARLEVEGGMRAEAVRRNKRAFEMHTENGGRAGGVIAARIFKRDRHRLVHERDLFERSGDRGRHPGGRAFAREVAAESS